MSKSSSRTIVCMKWGTKYGPEYVNRLYAMVRRHLHAPPNLAPGARPPEGDESARERPSADSAGDFDFVCLTDRTEGIRSEVRCFPIPELTLPNGEPERGWKKLTTFSPVLVETYGLSGTALFLDLDVVIVDDITPFFEVPGEFLVIHDWKRPWRVTGNSSVYRWQLGAHQDVLAEFVADQAKAKAEFRNEQAFLSAVLHRQGKLKYWDDAWCASYKYHCIPAWPTSYWRDPFIPKGARILIFHGVMNPPDALAGRSNGNWRHARPARWISDHWRE